jgi:hypothetical protein
MLRWGVADGQAQVSTARTEALQNPESDMLCTFIDGGYSYEDAVLLATYWGKKEPWGAS